MKEIIFLNGKFLSGDEAKISVLEPGFLYGWGLFETMRAYHGRIICFDAHLERLRKSAGALGIECPYSSAKLKEIILRLVRISGLGDANVRVTLWKREKGTDILARAKKYQSYSLREYKKGFYACISRFRQNEDSCLAQLKTTNYLLYRLAYLEAAKKGFDEALILNQRGYLAEGSRSNLFFAKGKELFTPSLRCGCLGGITRKAVFDLAGKYNIRVFEGNFTVSDLSSADEAFLTNSLMGIMPLASLEGRRIGRGAGWRKLTSFFTEKYKSLF